MIDYRYIQKWLASAKLDLAAALKLSEGTDAFNKVIIYHCQQSIEKYLKAYHIVFGLEIKKTHNLKLLISILEEYDKGISRFSDQASYISNLANNVRYPDEFEDWKSEDSEKSLELANEIAKYIHDKIEPTA